MPLGEQVRIYGDGGTIVVLAPWFPGPTGVIHVHAGDAEPRVVQAPASRGIHALEADVAASSLHANEAPAMPWSATLVNMRTLDRWRDSVGLRFEDGRR